MAASIVPDQGEAYPEEDEEETKAVTNSHLWAEFGQSTSNSQGLSHQKIAGLSNIQSEAQIQSILDQFSVDKPHELKNLLMKEISKSNEMLNIMVDRVKWLEQSAKAVVATQSSQHQP